MGARGKRGGIGAALCLALCALLGALAPAAEAWQSVPVPGAQPLSFAAANADTLLVQSGSAGFDVTGNRGASWSHLDLAGYDFAAVLGAAPDGSFRVIAVDFNFGGQRLQVFRVTAAGAAEPLGAPILAASGAFGEHRYALDGDGTAYVPYVDEVTSTYELRLVAPDGTSSTRALPAIGAEDWYPERTALGMRLMAFGGAGSTPGVPRRGTYALQGEGFAPAEAFPVEFAEGGYWYSAAAERVSFDAGAHWSEAFDSPQIVLRNAGPPRFLDLDGVIAQRYSPFLYAGTGAEVPGGVGRVIDTGDALVAMVAGGLLIEPLPLPPAPTEIGQVPPDSKAMIDRANQFRADAGLPPLIGDAGISLAAHDHSVYTAQHPDELEGLSAHGETPGHAGYTGRSPDERCAAVGARCGSEVMYAPVSDPVGGWLATVYHRPLPGGPEASTVGGGKVDGGWYVMDGGADRNLLLQPFGYPVGRWRGEDGFHGEIPDPAEACREAGQPISYPAGIAVTLYLPHVFASVDRIVVRKQGTAKALPGCLLTGPGSFILDDPLERGATYDVEATWTPEAEPVAGGVIPAAPLSTSWSFRFQPDDYGRSREKHKKPCRALRLRTIRSVAPAGRRGRRGQVLGIEEKVTLGQKGRVRLRRAHLNYWKAGRRYSVDLPLGRLARRPVVVGRVSYLRLRLPPRVASRVIAGEPAELWLKFTGRRVDTCKRSVHVSRVRKVELGWIRVAGPAAWVSAKRKRRHGHH